MLNNTTQQFVILILSGLALFIWAYYLGYNKAYKHHVLDDIEEVLNEKDLEQYKKQEEYQMQ